jgi:hypothetical protein
MKMQRDRKIRVHDWFLDLVLPPDIVQIKTENQAASAANTEPGRSSSAVNQATASM